MCRTVSTNARPGAKNHSVQRDQTPKYGVGKNNEDVVQRATEDQRVTQEINEINRFSDRKDRKQATQIIDHTNTLNANLWQSPSRVTSGGFARADPGVVALAVDGHKTTGIQPQ